MLIVTETGAFPIELGGLIVPSKRLEAFGAGSVQLHFRYKLIWRRAECELDMLALRGSHLQFRYLFWPYR